MPEQPTRTRENLRIWQQNVNCSHTAQDEILRLANPKDWDIVTIQEPYFTPFNLAPVSSHWHTVYPTNHIQTNQARSRSLTLVSKHISTNEWSTVPFDSRDVTCIELTTSAGQIKLYNIYNDGNSDDTLESIYTALTDNPRSTNTILLGDFNRHHPMWDEPRNHHLFTEHRMEAAQNLIDLLDRFDLNMTLPPEIPTLELSSNKNLSRPDNVFMSSPLTSAVTRCTALEAPRISCTDHFTIQTTLTLTCKKAVKTLRPDFKGTDWTKFNKALERELPRTRQPAITTREIFDQRLDKITAALDETIYTLVPLKNDSPYMKRWWTPELKRLQKVKSDLSKAARRHKATPSHPLHRLYKEADTAFRTAKKRAKRDCWNTFIDDADEDKIWIAHKFLTAPPTDGGAARIPSLNTTTQTGTNITCVTNEEKSNALHESFFPPAQNPTIQPEEYPDPVERFQHITKDQLNRIITESSRTKPPAPMGYPTASSRNAEKPLSTG